MFEDAIGRVEVAEDVITAPRMVQIAAMLGLGDNAAALSAKGADLPPLFHLFFAHNPSDAGGLDADGHERLGQFIPDVTQAGPYHRRMWAAGDIRFQGQVQVGDRIQRTSTITAIEEKQGKSGGLVFVTVARQITSANGQIDEARTIVYREKPDAGTLAQDSIPLAADQTLPERGQWMPDLVQLFRFSALTWNGHRIHYDLAHCREDEGYPDIITHGPFTALMLANLTADGVRFAGNPLKRFQFRGVQPLYANRAVGLKMGEDGTRLEATNHQGQLAMTATRTLA